MPTDALRALRDTMKETQLKGFNYLQKQQEHLGEKVRQLMVSKNFTSVAAEGFQSPCVVVSYTADKNIQTGQKFMEVGLQISAGIPLQCDEDPEFKTFRLGLFGLEKLLHINRTVRHLENAINKITAIN